MVLPELFVPQEFGQFELFLLFLQLHLLTAQDVRKLGRFSKGQLITWIKHGGEKEGVSEIRMN